MYQADPAFRGRAARVFVQLNFHRVDLRLARAWTLARTKAATVARVAVVELVAADGTRGVGEAAPVARYKESLGSVEAFFRKVDPRGLSFNDVAGSMSYLDTVSAHDMSAKCAINLALLDGAARRAGKPVCDFLGLGFRENQHVTSFTLGIDSPEVMRAKALEAEPYPILKVKLGVAEDRAILQAVREAAPAKPLRVDANEGWKTREEALERIQWLAADGNIQFVEQPLPAGASLRDWRWLRERSPLPLFGDESYHFAEDIAEAAECFHGVNVKLIKTGGITAGIKALREARNAGLKTMIGCMVETSILISAAAHLAELCDYLDLDGNLLVTNDPYAGVTAEKGVLSFAQAPEKAGLRVAPREILLPSASV
jgi:L-alanine-DL-glutamate epimerase-like enolase superfamily enzyme